MKILGLSAGFHDASVSVIEDDKILFAAHSERYSKKKHDADLCPEIMREAMSFCDGRPDAVAFYERPWVKKMRQLYAGQYSDAFDMSDLTVRRYLKKTLPNFLLDPEIKCHHFSHHLSHAASAFQTSPFKRATVVVIDAIGEWDTVSVLGASYSKDGFATYKTLWKQRYPNSLGLLYSAMTQRVGLRPLDEEYILMGMASYGKPRFLEEMDATINNYRDLKFRRSFHRGTGSDFLVPDSEIDAHKFDIASSTQVFAEFYIESVMDRASKFEWSENLVYAGGVALNCLANRNLGRYFDNIWIMPNPGDAGGSLGAAAIAYGKRLDWDGPFLGTRIPGYYPYREVLNELLTTKIVGVAAGRAEFGPRALGNRSLLADPRGPEIKDKINEIKRRQKFRPFAPVILEEHVNDYFVMPHGFYTSPYMQATAVCKRPDLFPAIVHVDGTSRVQTVSRKDQTGIRELLERWYETTGCPMLLNTSLNIRGEPMVNDRSDADRFELLYGIRVYS